MSKIVPKNCPHCGEYVGDWPENDRVSHGKCAFEATKPIRERLAANRAALDKKQREANG